MVESFQLSNENVLEAEKRPDKQHPVIRVIELNLSKITQLNKQCAQISYYSDKQDFIETNFGFLGTELANAGQFELEPLDLISIWAYVLKIYPLQDDLEARIYHRRNFSRLITSAYAVQDLNEPKWKDLPKIFLERGELPPEIIEDKAGLLVVSNRLTQLSENLAVIKSYIWGIDNADTVISKLINRAFHKDDEVSTAYEKLSKSRINSPVLDELLENFAYGVPYLFDEVTYYLSH